MLGFRWTTKLPPKLTIQPGMWEENKHEFQFWRHFFHYFRAIESATLLQFILVISLTNANLEWRFELQLHWSLRLILLPLYERQCAILTPIERLPVLRLRQQLQPKLISAWSTQVWNLPYGNNEHELRWFESDSCHNECNQSFLVFHAFDIWKLLEMKSINGNDCF